MTEGVIWKQLMLFAIPLILGDLFQQLYNTVDSIIVGRYISKQALAAVSSTTNVVNSVIGIFTGLSVGATVTIARFFGAKDSEKLSDAVHTTIVLTIVISIILTAVGVLGTPFLLMALGTPADVFHDAKIYLQIYFGGISGLTFYNMLGGILRAVGDSRRPLIALIFSAVINIALDLISILVFDMGVSGAAWATVIAQILSMLYLLGVLICNNEAYALRFSKIRADRVILKRIFNVGIPIGIQKSITSFSNVLVLSHINYFGSSAMAAWGIFQKIDQVDTHVLNSMSSAVTTFTSQNLGACKEKRINTGLRTAIGLSAIIVFAVASLGISFDDVIISLFNGDAEIGYYVKIFFRTMLPMRLILCVSFLYSGLARGFGDSRIPMYVMLGCHVGLRQLYLYFGWPYIKSVPFVVSSYMFSWVVSLVIMAFFKHKKYDKTIKLRG